MTRKWAPLPPVISNTPNKLQRVSSLKWWISSRSFTLQRIGEFVATSDRAAQQWRQGLLQWPTGRWPLILTSLVWLPSWLNGVSVLRYNITHTLYSFIFNYLYDYLFSILYFSNIHANITNHNVYIYLLIMMYEYLVIVYVLVRKNIYSVKPPLLMYQRNIFTEYVSTKSTDI